MKFVKISALLFAAFVLCSFTEAVQTEVQLLSGTGEDNTVDWEFYCTGGNHSGEWTTIPVPSCWELQGFGSYHYGWDEDYTTEHGIYRRSFKLSPAWKDRKVFVVFEGVMTDAEVKVNGSVAGPIHQGAFYRFKYDITDKLNFDGENIIEVDVAKESSNASINRAERRADYWLFGGIFRPVYLEAVPKTYVERVAIDARHDGQFRMQAFLGGEPCCTTKAKALIVNDKGHRVGKLKGVFQEDGTILFDGKIRRVKAWTPETPSMYRAIVSIGDGHRFYQNFGFRTIEFKTGDGFFLNGTKIHLKGVCRHTFWPESGRTSSRRLAIEDVENIKDMNMNAVRMSHYPPDQFFLDVCDSLGLLVIDELAGWQTPYDDDVACEFAKNMVCRDQNHPCVFLWSNGNEGGFPEGSRGEYAKWDLQQRKFIEPWSKIGGTNTKHYTPYRDAERILEDTENVFFPTENIHGLHDGGHGAGLSDNWSLVTSHQNGAGMFLWVYADEGVVRHDLRDTIDCQGAYAPDGIVGPHHEKEGSFYTIKEVWTPVYVETPDFGSFDGTIAVENRNSFVTLKGYSFKWTLEKFSCDGGFAMDTVSGSSAAPAIAAGDKGTAKLRLPSNWRDYDCLGIEALDPQGHSVCRWGWPLSSADEVSGRVMMDKGFSDKIPLMKFRFVCDGKDCDIDHISVFELPGGGMMVCYEYVLDGDCSYAGIGMDFEEDGVIGADLLARGPYHVWKNRKEGVPFGLYAKSYNNGLAGERWEFPEFKGFYSDFYAVAINCERGVMTIANKDADRYLMLFRYPESEHFAVKGSTPEQPDCDIAVLNCISPIGTKFFGPEALGPSSQKNHYDHERVKGTFYVGFKAASGNAQSAE